MKELNEQEEMVMKQTFKVTMLRAAEIIDRITQEDVADAQMALYREGVKLSDLAKIDRALIASCHLRSCAELSGNADDTKRAKMIAGDLKSRLMEREQA